MPIIPHTRMLSRVPCALRRNMQFRNQGSWDDSAQKHATLCEPLCLDRYEHINTFDVVNNWIHAYIMKSKIRHTRNTKTSSSGLQRKTVDSNDCMHRLIGFRKTQMHTALCKMKPDAAERIRGETDVARRLHAWPLTRDRRTKVDRVASSCSTRMMIQHYGVCHLPPRLSVCLDRKLWIGLVRHASRNQSIS